ncbi:hypothetical protein D3C87_628360 [compost metagenome]
MDHLEEMRNQFEISMHEALVNTCQLSNFDTIEDENIKALKYTYVIYSERASRCIAAGDIPFDEFVHVETMMDIICPALDIQDLNEELDYMFVHKEFALFVFTSIPVSPAWFRIKSGWNMIEVRGQRTLWDFVHQYRASLI